MHVLYTYDIFAKQVYGGISRYIVELSRHMPSEVTPVIFAGLHINAYVHVGEAKGIRIPKLPYCAPIRERISKLAQRAYAIAAPPDIYHRTYYGSPFKRGPRPMVLTVYDMIHERFPSFYQDGGNLSTAKRKDCDAADHIIAISESTKRDLIEYFSVAPDKISVVHLASTELAANPVRSLTLTQNRPYLLFVGQRDGYKNFGMLLEAYAASPRLVRAFDLVCFGGGAASSVELKRVETFGLSKQLRFVNGAEEDLRAYYEGARLLVYPSKYEGFGMPVLEAMQAGCPVMCSISSSLPEVAGEAAVYINSSFSEQLEKLAFDDTRLAALKAAGYARARKFSWAKCAVETTSVYRSLRPC